jgi:hypothetical protein
MTDQLHDPCRLTCEIRAPWNYWIGGWIGSTADRLCVEENTLLSLPENDPQYNIMNPNSGDVHPSRYTGWVMYINNTENFLAYFIIEYNYIYTHVLVLPLLFYFILLL